MYLFFDTETTGLPKNWKAPETDSDNWPRLVQLAYIQTNEAGDEIIQGNFIIRPEGFVIPEEVSKIHGITHERALNEGVELTTVLLDFAELIEKSDCIVGHNVVFDKKIVGAEFHRFGIFSSLKEKETICTMMKSTNYCGVLGDHGLKWPKLQELHTKLFGVEFEAAHDASADIAATKKCFFELQRIGII